MLTSSKRCNEAEDRRLGRCCHGAEDVLRAGRVAERLEDVSHAVSLKSFLATVGDSFLALSSDGRRPLP